MRDFLVSLASPESLSWIGFLILAGGLLGDVAVLILPEKHVSHKFFGLFFTAIVLVGYLIGHIGDDAITTGFAERAKNAETEVSKLKTVMSKREFPEVKRVELASFIKKLPAPPRSTVVFDSVVGNPEAKQYGDQLAKALSGAIGGPIDNPRGLSSCLEYTGVWICVNDNATKETSDDGKAIRSAFELAGVAGAKFCTDPKNSLGTPTTVKVIVGPKE